VAGPFRRWWHEHRFDVDGDGTLMTDRVEFEAPLGPVGRAVAAIFLTRYMTRLLDTRNQWLAAALTTTGD
jgi:ligand-binding SRPBCC domain-containing protein